MWKGPLAHLFSFMMVEQIPISAYECFTSFMSGNWPFWVALLPREERFFRDCLPGNIRMAGARPGECRLSYLPRRVTSGRSGVQARQARVARTQRNRKEQ